MTSKVVVNGMASGDINIKQSVRQGSILGPLLYMLYVHDLAEELKMSHHACQIGIVPCGGILQAEDIALMSLNPCSLQHLMYICERYSRKWWYNYNPVK